MKAFLLPVQDARGNSRLKTVVMTDRSCHLSDSTLIVTSLMV
jgi:hypothetical protein